MFYPGGAARLENQALFGHLRLYRCSVGRLMSEFAMVSSKNGFFFSKSESYSPLTLLACFSLSKNDTYSLIFVAQRVWESSVARVLAHLMCWRAALSAVFSDNVQKHIRILHFLGRLRAALGGSGPVSGTAWARGGPFLFICAGVLLSALFFLTL